MAKGERAIEIEMPSPGSFHCSPSGDTEYAAAIHEAIEKGIPKGYELVGNRSDVKTEHRTIVQHFAIIKVKPAPPEYQV